MKTLDDAWRWYQDAKKSLLLVHRFGEKHWRNLPRDLPLRRDDAFRLLEPLEITAPAQYALNHLDDLAIVVMFSVFEATVREKILAQIKPEADSLQHQSLKEAAEDLAERIRVGSFYHVLAPFRAQDPNLTEQIDQVRNYRNWVAHGKRKAVPNAVTPDVAYGRLARFLEACVTPELMSEEEWLAVFRVVGE